jgi:hypothetical protein
MIVSRFPAGPHFHPQGKLAPSRKLAALQGGSRKPTGAEWDEERKPIINGQAR